MYGFVMEAVSNSSDTHPMVSTEEDSLIQSLAFLFSIFLCGALIQFLTGLIKFGLPYTVVVFVLGMLVGISEVANIRIGPHLMLNIFMPILIFEGAFAMDVYVLRKVFWQALFMAGPGLVVITSLTAGVAQPLMRNDDWGWPESVLFGSILSATDPVAVVALLKELGASPFLSLFIEGESLLNDGTAMVGFTVLYNVITGSASLTAEYVIVGGFLRFAVGGPLFGYFMARCCIGWLSKTFNDPLSEIAATLTSAFLTFFVAENFFHVSGVLALVVLGVVLSNNRTSISPEVETFLHSFWETLAYLANTLIFFLVGMIVMQLMQRKAQIWDFVINFLIYVSVNSIRAMVIILFSPLLKRIGYDLPWQFTIVASWSGLRGAVGLALALMVYETPEEKIPKDTVSYRVFFHLCGIVFLTLVINATTISKILALLGMSNVSAPRRAAMATSLSIVANVKHRTICVWRTDRFLTDVDWTLVDDWCTLREPWDLTQEEEDEGKQRRVWAVCPHCEEEVPYQPTVKELMEMRNEAILRLLKAEKLSYWRQFEHGMLSTEAVRTLHEACEMAADKKRYLDVGVIKSTWKITTLTKVVEWFKRQDLSRIELSGVSRPHPDIMTASRDNAASGDFCEKRPWTIGRLLTNRYFIVITAVVLFFSLDAPLNVAMFIMDVHETGDFSELNATHGASMVCWLLMVIYGIVRLVVLKRAYMRTPWFWISVVILVSGLVDIGLLLYLALGSIDNETRKQYHFIIVGLCLVRQLHALEAFIPLIIMVLENQEVQRLIDGYDVGRGYVMGEEEIRGRIDHMADRKDIIDGMRNHCDSAKMEILKCLGLLQKDYPEVAMGVKTRQAIRSVLNNLRYEVHALLQDGLLEEAEGNELAGMVESKMKRLLTAPPKVPLPSTEKILQNVPWIADNEDLVQFIKARAHLRNYEYGDIIMHQDDPTTGVSIILSGLVKLELQIPLPMDETEKEQKYMTRILDFFTAGNVLGEIGVLTGKPRSATVKCETGVQLLEIDIKDIQAAFKEFENMEPPLKYRLWRLSAIRVCTVIFLDQPAFQGMTKEKLRVRLENGYVEEVGNTPCSYAITPYTGELVLLHGDAVDGYTHEKYSGPCYIPQKVKILTFETCQDPNPALFILPPENQPLMCRPSLSLAIDTQGLDDLAQSMTMQASLANMSPASLWKRPLEQIREEKRSRSGNSSASSYRKSLQSTSRRPSTQFFIRRIVPSGAKKSFSTIGRHITSSTALHPMPPLEPSAVTSISLTDHLPQLHGEDQEQRSDHPLTDLSRDDSGRKEGKYSPSICSRRSCIRGHHWSSPSSSFRTTEAMSSAGMKRGQYVASGPVHHHFDPWFRKTSSSPHRARDATVLSGHQLCARDISSPHGTWRAESTASSVSSRTPVNTEINQGDPRSPSTGGKDEKTKVGPRELGTQTALLKQRKDFGESGSPRMSKVTSGPASRVQGSDHPTDTPGSSAVAPPSSATGERREQPGPSGQQGKASGAAKEQRLVSPLHALTPSQHSVVSLGCYLSAPNDNLLHAQPVKQLSRISERHSISEDASSTNVARPPPTDTKDTPASAGQKHDVALTSRRSLTPSKTRSMSDPTDATGTPASAGQKHDVALTSPKSPAPSKIRSKSAPSTEHPMMGSEPVPFRSSPHPAKPDDRKTVSPPQPPPQPAAQARAQPRRTSPPSSATASKAASQQPHSWVPQPGGKEGKAGHSKVPEDGVPRQGPSVHPREDPAKPAPRRESSADRGGPPLQRSDGQPPSGGDDDSEEPVTVVRKRRSRDALDQLESETQTS